MFEYFFSHREDRIYLIVLIGSIFKFSGSANNKEVLQKCFSEPLNKITDFENAAGKVLLKHHADDIFLEKLIKSCLFSDSTVMKRNLLFFFEAVLTLFDFQLTNQIFKIFEFLLNDLQRQIKEQ